jgi:hypothetical protein
MRCRLYEERMLDWNMEEGAARACLPLPLAPSKSKAGETRLGLAEEVARPAALPERVEEVA